MQAPAVRLAEIIGRWLGRVEVVIAGADDALHQGELALAAGNPMAARTEAKAVLDRVPGSPLGLALLADACEMANLQAELALTLEDLALRVGSQADVWVRLGRARQATLAPLDDIRDAYVRGLAVAESGSEARHEALLALTDLDLAASDGVRAELWLDRIARDDTRDVVVRRAEARLARGDTAGALAWLARGGEPAPTDGRDALVRGKALALSGDSRAFAPLLRAVVLDVPGATGLLSSFLAHAPADEATRGRIRAVVAARGEAESTRWRAAFARAEGRHDEARRALMDAVRAGDSEAASALLDAAIDDCDHEALQVALARLPEHARCSPAARDSARLPSPEALRDPARAAAHFDVLAEILDERVRAWADLARTAAARALVPQGAGTEWRLLLARLDHLARELHDLDATAALASLAAERTRPVRVAVIGEFNAGKSTFINALIGADVAPTGVLPTTATLHHLRYATDPIARVHLHKPLPASSEHEVASTSLERIVPISELRAALAASRPGDVKRVEILLPIASLTRVEVIDTPGFNAPDVSHAEAARAAFEEADAVIWLADAVQAMKKTERDVLEQVEATHLPIQVLVNKADRLAKGDLEKVMTLVRESLALVGITPWTPPLAFSAKLALKGKLGDADAMAASGWAAIESLLETEIVAKSEVLKERALRRRALKVVTSLGALASQMAKHDDDRQAAETRAAQDVSQAAARLDRNGEAAAQELEAVLGKAGATWQREIDLVVTGRDPKTVAADPLFARYRTERALVLMAPPLAEAMARLAAPSSVTSADVTPVARALVRAYVARPGGLSVPPLARAAADALVEHLTGFAVSAHAPGVGAGRVRELAALAEALGFT
jgi:GTP-binding protein EngB required for normal cell division